MDSNRTRLVGLSSIEYEHDFDRSALRALKNTAGLPKVIETINKHSLDRIIKVNHTGSYLLAGEKQCSKVYKLFDRACEILDIQNKPKLYIRQGYGINAYATCYSYPIVTLYTGAIENLSDEELMFIIGHELGHIKSEHLLYNDVANKMSIISRIITDMTLGFGGILSTGLQVALLYWSRMAEFTCDRAGLLVCQDFEVARNSIIKLSGGILFDKSEINVDAFMDQVKEFEGYDYDQLDKAAKIFSVLDDTHPWTVMRTAELEKWIVSGEYESVISRERNRVENLILCTSCLTENNSKSNFCKKCGTKLVS